MKLLSILPLAFLWVAVQAAGHHGCCRAFSKVRAVNTIVKRGGAVQCRQQNITEVCSINAVIIKWKRRLVCVDPTPSKMQNVLAILCSNKKPHEAVRNHRRPHRRKNS